MTNISSHLKQIEQRLSRRSMIDPELAIKTLFNFIDLSCYEGTIPEDKRITLYDFVWLAENEFESYRGMPELETRKEIWREMEINIRSKEGFKPDPNDEKALRIKEF